MPRISSFRGITIRMFFNEYFHPGKPHFHAEYAGAKATFEIVRLRCLAGGLPPGAQRMVKRWAREHPAELMANWERARNHQPLESIDPLGLMSYYRNVLSLPPRLIEAKPLSGYEVHLCFVDGLAADIDLSYLLDFGGVFEPLRDIEFFRELTIDDGGNTVCWPNEADIAPETLYDHVQRAEYEKRRAE